MNGYPNDPWTRTDKIVGACFVAAILWWCVETALPHRDWVPRDRAACDAILARSYARYSHAQDKQDAKDRTSFNAWLRIEKDPTLSPLDKRMAERRIYEGDDIAEAKAKAAEDLDDLEVNRQLEANGCLKPLEEK